MPPTPRSRRATGAEPGLAAYRPALRAAAMNLCRQQQEADDLVQDTYERALRHLAADRPAPQNPRAWLFSILKNAFIDRLRSARMASPLEVEPTAPEPEPSPLWSRVSADHLRAAVSELPLELRAPFELHYFEHTPYRRVAETLRIPENTVASRLHRARRELRDILNRMLRLELCDEEGPHGRTSPAHS